MSDDLIKRSDAIKVLCDAVDNKGNYEGEWLYTDEFCKAIDSVPSIDIVRCGACKKRKKNCFCLEHMRYEKNDKGFCSYGCRKEE